MSAGPFVLSRYTADNGDIHPIRVQPETIIATFNPAPTGAVTIQLRVRASRSNRRRLGISARYVTCRWAATPPTGYTAGASFTLPILTPTAYNAIGAGTTFTYLGAGAIVSSKNPERSK